MNALVKKMLAFLVDEEAVTAVEYALLVFLLILVVLTGITWLGQATTTNFDADVR